MWLLLEKKQHSRTLLSRLIKSDADFMIGQNNLQNQNENKNSTNGEIIILINTNNPLQIRGSQVDMQTPEKNITNKVRCEVNIVMTTFEYRKHNAVITAIESLVIPRVERAMKSGILCSGRSVDIVVLDLDQRNFSGFVESFPMTASKRKIRIKI